MTPDSFQQMLAAGIQLHRAGRLDEAEGAYRQALALEPNQADALHMLGVIAHQRGRHDAAVDLIGKAVQSRPDFAEAYYNLGLALAGLHRQSQAAAAAYRRAIELKPAFAEAHNSLGAALKELGQLGEAEIALRRSIQLKPDFADAHSNLGTVLSDQEKFDEAIREFRRSIELNPNSAEAHANLGNALWHQGLHENAIAECRRAIQLKPDYATAHFGLASALKSMHQYREAVEVCHRAVQLKPDYAEGHFNLGNALNAAGEPEQAILEFNRAIELKPDFAEAYMNLGETLNRGDRIDEAMAAYQRSIQLKLDLATAQSNLAGIYKEQGKLAEAIRLYRRAVETKPNIASLHSNLLFAMHFQSEANPRAIFEESLRWAERHERPLQSRISAHAKHAPDKSPLRIGYVSPDFRRHSVAYFFENLLAMHDRKSVQTFCYSDVAIPDETTARLRQQASRWRDIAGMADSAVVDLIRKDGIDILVDLCGHTANNRLPVFAARPAPIQVTYLGYPDTTGMSTIDYRLTDVRADPPGQTESLHSERLVRLPRTFLCYRPAEISPAVGPPPVSTCGHIAFGSFNALPKINPPLVRLWAQILRQVPNSRMILKNRSLASPTARQWIMTLFANERIQPDRIELHRAFPDEQAHLQYYDRIDIALDTFPYHGTTTTCEAMWMGVPTVTLAGSVHLSRVGVSLLSNVGLEHLIAESPEQYVRVAVQTAGDVPGLQEMRRTLRQRMQQSPLMDALGFARDVEAAYRGMWQTWCAAAT